MGILILAAALSVLEKSVSAFSKMPVDELQNGIGVLGAILGEIAVFSMLSNPAEHVLSTATALTILSGGLLILSNALANLGGMTLGQIWAEAQIDQVLAPAAFEWRGEQLTPKDML